MSNHFPRALILAHYDPDGIVDPYVLYSLQKYRRAFEHITIVSVSADCLPPNHENLVDTFIRRENIGYDFYSWKVGFERLADKDKFFEVVFVNDSIYGPLFDIEHVLLANNIKEADLWGLTTSFQINSHIQSFFFAMRHSLLRSNAALEYWNSVHALADKASVIYQYELKLAAHFRDRGWRTETIYTNGNAKRSVWEMIRSDINIARPRSSARYVYHNLKSKNQNPTHYLWRSVIDAGVPFVKAEVFRINPLGLQLEPIRNYIVENTLYPFDLVSAHVRRTTNRSIGIGHSFESADPLKK